ncbi:unnamed protein product, partial [Heterosigma akashiwo]
GRAAGGAAPAPGPGHRARAGEEALEPVLAFLNRYVAQPKYTPLLVEVCQKVLDVYGGVLGESEAIDELFLK